MTVVMVPTGQRITTRRRNAEHADASTAVLAVLAVLCTRGCFVRRRPRHGFVVVVVVAAVAFVSA